MICIPLRVSLSSTPALISRLLCCNRVSLMAAGLWVTLAIGWGWSRTPDGLFVTPACVIIKEQRKFCSRNQHSASLTTQAYLLAIFFPCRSTSAPKKTITLKTFWIRKKKKKNKKERFVRTGTFWWSSPGRGRGPDCCGRAHRWSLSPDTGCSWKHESWQTWLPWTGREPVSHQSPARSRKDTDEWWDCTFVSSCGLQHLSGLLSHLLLSHAVPHYLQGRFGFNLHWDVLGHHTSIRKLTNTNSTHHISLHST